jgi:hypothetical protein
MICTSLSPTAAKLKSGIRDDDADANAQMQIFDVDVFLFLFFYRNCCYRNV